MSLARIAAVVLRQFILIRTSPARVFGLFVWAAIDVLLWGFITRYLNSVASPGFDFVPVLLGAVVLWAFFTRVMHGVALAFFEDVWSRNFLNLFASPLTISEYLAGLVFTTIATSWLTLLVLVVLAGAAFGLSYLVFGLTLLPFLLILFLFGVALGIIGVAAVLRLGPAAEWFVWPIPAIISPFVGVFYPISTLPPWMQAVAYLLPPAYVFEDVRAIVSGGTIPPVAMLGGAGLAALYVLLAAWMFRRVYARARRTGLIPRYSAETLS